MGLLSSAQSRVNGGLSTLWGSPQQAAAFSFGSGLVVMTVVVIAMPSVRQGLGRVWRALRTGSLRWWEVIGGFLGAMFVLEQSFVVPLVGVAAFTVGIVAGQTANSLVVDRFGVGPQGRIPVSASRLSAAGLAVVAVLAAVASRWGGDDETSILPILAAFGVGVLIAFQQAINGRVTVESGQPLAATWINFALGTILLVAIFIGSLLLGGEVAPFPGGHFLLYTGGLIGPIFIALAAWAVTRIGVLITSLLAIAGQLSSALVLDLVLPTQGAQVSAGLVFGVVLAFVAVLVGARRRPVT
jgi:transporter family-2 protein